MSIDNDSGMDLKDAWTTVEAAEAWAVSRQRVLALCKAGRVPGAEFDEQVNLWLVPKGTKNPAAKKSGPVPRKKP